MRTGRTAVRVSALGLAALGLGSVPEAASGVHMADGVAMVVPLGLGSVRAAASGYCFSARNREAGGGSLDSPPTAEGAKRWAPDVWGPGETLEFWVSSDNWPEGASPPEEWVALLQEAMAVWNEVATADISMRAAGVVSGAGRELDGLNTYYVVPADVHPGGTTYTRTNSDGFAEIIERDHALIPSDISNIRNRMGAFVTLIHGLGHGLGLCHSAAFPVAREDGHARGTAWPQTEIWPINNIMSYGPDNYSRDGVLGADEVTGASLLRPASGWIETTGSIAGRLRLVDGSPAAHAHVWALSRDGSSIRGGVGALSQLDGSFRIEGLVPGNYVLWAQPLLSQQAFFLMIRDRYPDAVLDLDDAIWPHLVPVRRGGTTGGIEIQMRRGREARPFGAPPGAERPANHEVVEVVGK